MEAAEVRRLREEQGRAIQVTNDEIDKWKKLNNDYENLSSRLLTLPNKITHEVMVPFGPMAFMPGQLVHTNEILVLLGDNWFAERSAKQAAEIVTRRKKAIEKQLSDLRLQKNLLINRTSFTDEIQNLSEGSGDIKEINEKYDEEKEKKWKIQHKKNVKKYHKELQKKKLENPDKDEKVQTDQSIWERLDELEKLEAEQNELDEDYTANNSKSSQEGRRPSLNAAENASSSKKSVRWVDEQRKESGDTDDSSSGSEDGKGTGDRENLGVIHFTHTPVEFCLTEPTENTSTEMEGNLKINSPTDIYKYFVKQRQATPKSILKSPSFEEEKLPQEITPAASVTVEKKEPKNTTPRKPAIAKEVVETVLQVPTNQNAAVDPYATKKMSKFKASRLQR